MNITVKGVDTIAQDMKDRASRLPLAVYNALNVTGNDIRRNLKNVMKSVFVEPTPFILNSIEQRINQEHGLIGLANSRGALQLTVWVDPFNEQGENVLRPEIFGGERALKRSEQALRAKGILPPDKYVAPASSRILDAYGNIPGSLMRQILSSLSASQEVGYLMNKTSKSRSKAKKRYFVMKSNFPRPGGEPTGIWERVGLDYKMPVLRFVSKPAYKPRFDFFGVAQSTALMTFPINLARMTQK